MELAVVCPCTGLGRLEGGSAWPDVVLDLVRVIREHRSVIVFVSQRRQAERLAAQINEEAAKDLAMELDRLSEEERTLLTESLDDIIRDTPRTPLAATRFKKHVGKAGAEVGSLFRELLVDICSETAKKIIWPNQSM